MFPNKPRRLNGFAYSGMHRYFVTICVRDRVPVFRDGDLVEPVRMDLLQASEHSEFSVFANCFMPDHVHMLLLAQSDAAPLLECVRRFKQVSAFGHRQRTGRILWQTSFYERVLRDDEETAAVARYILENPVRAGLTRSVQDFPFSGSAVFTREQMESLGEKGRVLRPDATHGALQIGRV